MSNTIYVREIPEYVLDGLRLGRHVEHDDRSRDYAFTVPRKLAVQPLQPVQHQRYIPILDQGEIGSCTGNAGEGAAGTAPAFAAIPAGCAARPDPGNGAGDESQALSLYSHATELDNIPGTYPPTDTGSTGIAAAKAMMQAGLISGYQHTFTLSDALAALQIVPLMFGINWYTSFDMPDANGLVTITPGATVRGGHEVLATELVADRQLIGFDNSWSMSWGLQGRFYMSFADADRLLGEQGDVIVPVPLSQPVPVPVQPAQPQKPAQPGQPAPGSALTPVEELERQMWSMFKSWAKLRGFE